MTGWRLALVLVVTFLVGFALHRHLTMDPAAEIRAQLEHFRNVQIQPVSADQGAVLRSAYATVRSRVGEGKAALVVFGSPT